MWRLYPYKERGLTLFTILGSFGSILGLLLNFSSIFWDTSWWTIILPAVTLALLLLAAVLVLKSGTKTRVYRIGDSAGIRDYLYQWIKNGGRVAIWTRDMSWAGDNGMTAMLRRKAETGELIICLPRETTMSDYLKKHGAEVVAYDTWESPVARFTIVNYHSTGSRVAIGKRKDDLHIIQELSSDGHAAFEMAQDLVRLVLEQKRAIAQ